MSNIPEIVENESNQVTVELPGNKRVYFSYKTAVAFSTPKTGLRVCQNAWSNTTGRHLSEIDGGSKEAKAARIPYQRFKQEIEAAFNS